MLKNETFKLQFIKLSGFASALDEQNLTSGVDVLNFDTRFGLLDDQEYNQRQNTRKANIFGATGTWKIARPRHLETHPPKGDLHKLCIITRPLMKNSD